MLKAIHWLFCLSALAAGAVSASPTLVDRANSNGTYAITLKNNCAFQVWPAASQWNRMNFPAAQFPQIDAGQQGLGAGGLAKGASVTIRAPTNWITARVWARTGCVASGNVSQHHCL